MPRLGGPKAFYQPNAVHHFVKHSCFSKLGPPFKWLSSVCFPRTIVQRGVPLRTNPSWYPPGSGRSPRRSATPQDAPGIPAPSSRGATGPQCLRRGFSPFAGRRRRLFFTGALKKADPAGCALFLTDIGQWWWYLVWLSRCTLLNYRRLHLALLATGRCCLMWLSRPICYCQGVDPSWRLKDNFKGHRNVPIPLIQSHDLNHQATLSVDKLQSVVGKTCTKAKTSKCSIHRW